MQGGFAPFALPHQCVGCLRECGAVGVAVGSGKGFVFEGDGDIDSAVALFFQACKCASKVFRRAFDGFVSEVLLLLLGKTGVYPGRTAVWSEIWLYGTQLCDQVRLPLRANRAISER